MTNKNRKLLKRMGMLEEFDIWKDNLPKLISLNPKVGTKVRFILKPSAFPRISVGDVGEIVPTHSRYMDNTIQVKTASYDEIPLWRRELRKYLEEV